MVIYIVIRKNSLGNIQAIHYDIIHRSLQNTSRQQTEGNKSSSADVFLRNLEYRDDTDTDDDSDDDGDTGNGDSKGVVIISVSSGDHIGDTGDTDADDTGTVDTETGIGDNMGDISSGDNVDQKEATRFFAFMSFPDFWDLCL